MGKRSYIILYTCLLTLCNLFAQSAQQADEEFANKEYAKAKVTYGNLLRKTPQNPLYLYRYARCSYELHEEEEAIRYFEEAGEKYTLRNFYLGELYLSTYRFEQAITAYQKYAQSIDENHERYDYIQKQIAQAQKGARYLKRVDDIVITDSIILRKDNFLNAYHLSKESGSLFLSGGEVGYNNERQDRRLISTEGNGQKDLLGCQRLLDGNFICDTLPVPVNSSYNEAYPFVLADGVTLYFASDSPEGLGGYDLYITRYNSDNESYLLPENLGMPFNSPKNDYMLAIDEIRHIGYFATDRHTADSLVTIYTFIPNEEKQILRDQPEDYIRLAAQLKVHRNNAETKTILPPLEKTQNSEDRTAKEEFVFILNDSIIYSHLQDFRSTDARTLYEQYLLLEQYLNECITQTASYREEYKNTDDNRRMELKETLLQLEKEYIVLLNKKPKLLYQIRILEHKAL